MNRLILIGLKDRKYQQLKASIEEVLSALDHELIIEEQNDIDRILSYKLAEIPALLFRNHFLLEGGDLPSSDELIRRIIARLEEEPMH
jgi:6-pyruvoyl-tetrahydropterin synthase